METLSDIGKNAAGLILNSANTSLKIANKGVETVGVVADAGLDATGKITNSGLKTASGVVEHAGTAAVAGVNTLASIVSIVRDLTIRTEKISKNAVERQQKVEELKNSELKKQVDVGIVKNTEETQKYIETIKTEAENAKLKIQKDAELERQQILLKAENERQQIEAIDEQEKINQQLQHQSQKEELQENLKNYKESSAYGFTDDKSFTPGSIKKKSMFNTSKKEDFQYFIIVGVLDKNKNGLPFFELHPEDLSYKQANDIKRTNKLNYKDTDGNDVRIVLRKILITGFFPRFETTIDVYDVNTPPKLIITGIPVFLKKKYFKFKQPVPRASMQHKSVFAVPQQTLISVAGGKSRRQIKKHRTGLKKTKKRKNTKTRNKRRT
jgi:hypothetical protein